MEAVYQIGIFLSSLILRHKIIISGHWPEFVFFYLFYYFQRRGRLAVEIQFHIEFQGITSIPAQTIF